jgi:cell shape-determining protein MreC
VTAEIARAKSLLTAIRPATGDGSTTNTTVTGPEPTLESARVLEVNPNLRLVVLNVGLLHGVRVGMPFVVFRGDRVVAELKVVEVRRRICGALIENVDKDVMLTAGDAARVTKS